MISDLPRLCIDRLELKLLEDVDGSFGCTFRTLGIHARDDPSISDMEIIPNSL